MKRITATALLFTALLGTIASGQTVQVRPEPLQLEWYFGMTVRLTTVYQNGSPCRGLLITHVRRHGPADKSGLEQSDIILFANGRRFDQARNDHDAVSILQESARSAGGLPTATGGGVGTFVRPPAEGPGKVAMQVIDHRTNRRVWVTVHATYRGSGIETFRTQR